MSIDLEALRADSSNWDPVSFSPGRSEEWGQFDRNGQARLEALLSLQYDRRDTDLELLRHLLENEIIARETDGFQGIGDALPLASFLVARFKDPKDIPLFYRAKFANFDTACGFPREFIFVALGVTTSSYLEQNLPDVYHDLTKQMRNLSVCPDELESWWQDTERSYPDSEEEESPLARYERELNLQNEQGARLILDEWREREPDSDSKWSYLKYEYGRLGDHQEAVQCALKRSVEGLDAWDRASRLSDLIELHRKAGDYDSALRSACLLDEEFAGFESWIGVGLGRIAIHKVFELAESHPDADSATRTFKIADGWHNRSGDLALVGMEAGQRAASRCGLGKQASRYEAMTVAERERIAAMMS